MKRVLDYDPWSRTTTYHEYEEDTDTTIITEVQDIEPFMERAKAMRNDDQYTRDGIKNEMWHYAHIPNHYVMRMIQEDGINPLEKGAAPDVLRLINTKYTELKTTRKHHAGR